MGIGVDMNDLADKAAERLRTRTDKSTLKFFQILNELLTKAGISSMELPRKRKELQGMISARSARSRSAAAARRRNEKIAS